MLAHSSNMQDPLRHIILINAACLEQKLEIQILLSVV
jgi:hypothetical protein